MPLSLAQKSLLLFGGQSLTNYLLDLNAQGYIAAMYLADVASQATYTGTFAGTILRNAAYTSGAGAELVTNGAFTTDTGWTKGASWTISSGVANFDDTLTADIYQALNLVKGSTYRLTFDITSAGNANIAFASHIGELFVNYTNYTTGSYTLYFISPAASTTFGIYGNTAGVAFTIDNVSLKLIGQLDAAIGGTTPWLAGGGLSFDGLTSYAKVLNNAAWANLAGQARVLIGKPNSLGEGSGAWFISANNGADPDSHFSYLTGGSGDYDGRLWTSGTDPTAITNTGSLLSTSKHLVAMDYDDANVLGNGRKIRHHRGINGALSTEALVTDIAATGTKSNETGDLYFGNALAFTKTYDGTIYKAIIFNANAIATIDTILTNLTNLAGV